MTPYEKVVEWLKKNPPPKVTDLKAYYASEKCQKIKKEFGSYPLPFEFEVDGKNFKREFDGCVYTVTDIKTGKFLYTTIID